MLTRFSLLFSLLLACLLDRSRAVAQQPLGTLGGTVEDSVSRRPVAYATVVLLPAIPSPQVVANGTTKEQGVFVLANLPPGTFRLQVRFVGYTSHSQAVTVTAARTIVPPIRLAPATQQLGEAIVVGTKPLVEVRPDRLVYNAAQDVSNSGGTAHDVLRKTPLLAVDGLGNVTLNGAGNFKVLVNNHPSPTLAQNLQQALKGIAADQIQSVEIITTPSAKNDGEGTAGIINIMLKKEVRRNLNGRLGVSGGNRASEFTSALGLKRGRVAVNVAASIGRWGEPDRLTRRRIGFTSQGPDTLTQSGQRLNKGTWYNSTVSIDYDPAPYHSFSLLGTLGGYQAQGERDLFNRFVASDAALSQLYTRAMTELTGSLNTELTGTYTRTFPQEHKVWSALAQYARNLSTFGYDLDQYPNAAAALAQDRADYRERSRGRTPNHEVTVQMDFTQPLGEKKTLEAGLKAILRRTGSVASVEGFMPAQTTEFELLPDRGTDFSYKQDVQAAYASYTGNLGQKGTITLGSRVECTALSANFRSNGTRLAPRSYVSVLPNSSFQYALSDTSGLRVAYSRRITRPYIDYLNPFVDRSNSQNITYGNPALDPELTDAYEVSYHTVIHSAPVVVTGSVRHTGNTIEALRLPTSTAGVTAQTYANVASSTLYQLTLFGSAKPTPQWEVSGGPNVRYVMLLSPEMEIARRAITAGLSIDTSYQFTQRLRAQASVSGNLPTPTLQGQASGNLSYQVGMKKSVFGDKADVALNITNPFTNSFPNRSSVVTAFVDERTEYYSYQRGFRLSVNYRFGQDRPEREHKKANNDDLK